MVNKICKGCFEIFNSINKQKYCSYCIKEMEAKKLDKCLICGGHNVGDWGQCNECFRPSFKRYKESQ